MIRLRPMTGLRAPNRTAAAALRLSKAGDPGSGLEPLVALRQVTMLDDSGTRINNDSSRPDRISHLDRMIAVKAAPSLHLRDTRVPDLAPQVGDRGFS
jgi:hypothetical protein